MQSEEKEQLLPFDNDLQRLRKIRKIRSNFQKKNQDDINKIRTSKKTIKFAEQTCNMYV